jgi:hypothetical protein
MEPPAQQEPQVPLELQEKTEQQLPQEPQVLLVQKEIQE